jgi:hypothetical protein
MNRFQPCQPRILTEDAIQRGNLHQAGHSIHGQPADAIAA